MPITVTHVVSIQSYVHLLSTLGNLFSVTKIFIDYDNIDLLPNIFQFEESNQKQDLFS